MSIFSRISTSRQKAKEHNAKLAEQQKKEEDDKVPYKHIPTHAAADAIASAPPSWRETLDRPRIVEQNRRRSAMAASGHHMNMPGIPRVGSSLSHVSFPSGDATPMVRVPRAYSYTGVSSYANASRDIIYSIPDVAYSEPAEMKGKAANDISTYGSARVSPTSSKGEHSPLGSSNNSTSSQDDLEMRPASRIAAAADTTHRLHPSHPRRASDASIDRVVFGHSTKGPSDSRDSRPPPSVRGFSSIPPVAAPPPMQLGHLPGSLDAAVPSANGNGAGHAPTPGMAWSRQNSSNSLAGLTPASSRLVSSTPATPAATATMQTESPLHSVPIPGADLDIDQALERTGNTAATPPGKYKDRRTPKTTRFTELVPIESNVERSYFDLPRAVENHAPPSPAVSHEQVVNMFPEPSQPEVAQAPAPAKGKGKRVTKGGGKLVKKSRWSSSKSPAVAV